MRPWANFLLFGTNPRKDTPEEQARSITLSDRIVPYTLKRSRRRALSITIDHRGLRVLGPMRTTVREVEALLIEHESWVQNKLDEWRSERFQRSWSVLGLDPLPFLGRTLAVVVETHALRTPRIRHEAEQLILTTNNPADLAQNHRALVRWLREQALSCFEERVSHFAQQLGVAMPSLGLSQAKTRWGSCNNHGHIRLNWRLIHLPLSLVDYVVAHELAHLKEMNHSPRFWAVVAQMYPNWQQARRDLREHVSSLPQIKI